MTNKIMRSLSVGTMLYLLLIVGVLFWGPLSRPAVAQSMPQELAEAKAPVTQETPGPVDAPVIVLPPVVQKEALAPAEQVDKTPKPPQSVVEKQREGAPATTSLSETDQEAPIALVADSLTYNSEEESYEAKGAVVLRQAGVELKSDELLWQASTQDAAAQGSVQLNDAGAEVFGERLQYNMSTGQGQIRDGGVYVRKDNFHLSGAQIEKRSQSNYFVKNGSFTTCDGEIPDWKFSASEVDVTLGGYAQAKNVWFHIKDVPILYTPYLAFPVKTERESGFLSPWFGYSDNKGEWASLAWYQVIDRNMDATVYLDYLSEIGLGKGLEYRYALASQNNGKALYYHVSGFKETPNLYYLEWQHRGELPGNWRLTAEVEYVKEKLFFEEFGEVAEEYNRDTTVSTVMLRRNWQKLNLVGSARYIQDLETDNDNTLQRLPELGLGLSPYRLGDTPFYASLESYATRFWSEGGEDGERLYIRPALSAVIKPGSWLEIVPEVAFYERLYDAGAENDEKFVPEYSLAIATRLVKNFDTNRWGIDRIQHSIEPKAIYTYIHEAFQEDLTLFDGYDRIERRDDITYALVNRLTSRSTAVDGSRIYREFLNLRLSQRYDVDEAEHNRSGQNQPFSDVRAEFYFSPTRNVSLDVDALIPVYGDSQPQTLSVEASIRDNKGNAAKINYSYNDEDFAGVATDYVKFQLDTSVLKPLYVRFEERYDFRNNHELEKVLGLEYRSKCWSVFLTYRDRYQENSEKNHEFLFAFVLSGLGMNKGFGSGF